LIGSYSGQGILLASPLIKWYLDHGLVVTDIDLIIEYEPISCFRNFGEQVSTARRQGDVHPDFSILAETFKLLGNSAYGRCLTQKKRHRNVNYCNGEKADRLINSQYFSSISELTADLFEVQNFKDKVVLDLPIQIGLWVYSNAKLRMLEFYYDFLMKYVDESDFELTEMDTDSLYGAFAANDFDDLIKPEMRRNYFEVQHRWFPIAVCDTHRAKYVETRMEGKIWEPSHCCRERAAFDKRTPGLFKKEWEGTGIICLCSKTYFCYDDTNENNKLSCKGLNKNHNAFKREDFLQVLQSQRSGSGINVGFRVVDHNVLTYQQERCGLSYFYAKRKVLDDGVSTVPLEI